MMGENVFKDMTGEPVARAACMHWYAQSENFDWDTMKKRPGTHASSFKQMIWMDTSQLGVARRGAYVVAKYRSPSSEFNVSQHMLQTWQ